MESNNQQTEQSKGMKPKSTAVIIGILVGIAVVLLVVNALVKGKPVNNGNVTMGNVNSSTNQNVNTPANTNQPTAIDNTNQPPEVITSNVDTSDWKTYRNEELGIEFKYPDVFDNVSTYIGKESMRAGDVGNRFIILFSVRDKSGDEQHIMQLSGISKDYVSGRSGYFGDSQGYVLAQDGKYYFRFVDESSVLIEPIKVINAPIGKILIVDSNSFVDERGMSSGPSLNPGEGNFGALVNIQHKNFGGFSAFWQSNNLFPKEDFIRVLETISSIANQDFQ